MDYSPIKDYKAQAVMSMSKGEQLILLYEEALKNLRYACVMMQNNNLPSFYKCTQKSKDVFQYLISILNFNYDLSENLFKLYTFFKDEIRRAEIGKTCKPIEPIIPIVEDLKNTWVQADKNIHINK